LLIGTHRCKSALAVFLHKRGTPLGEISGAQEGAYSSSIRSKIKLNVTFFFLLSCDL